MAIYGITRYDVIKLYMGGKSIEEIIAIDKEREKEIKETIVDYEAGRIGMAEFENLACMVRKGVDTVEPYRKTTIKEARGMSALTALDSIHKPAAKNAFNVFGSEQAQQAELDRAAREVREAEAMEARRKAKELADEFPCKKCRWIKDGYKTCVLPVCFARYEK